MDLVGHTGYGMTNDQSQDMYFFVNNTNERLGLVHINNQGYPIIQALCDSTLQRVIDVQTRQQLAEPSGSETLARRAGSSFAYAAY
jgi:hypothetical protein